MGSRVEIIGLLLSESGSKPKRVNCPAYAINGRTHVHLFVLFPSIAPQRNPSARAPLLTPPCPPAVIAAINQVGREIAGDSYTVRPPTIQLPG